MTDTDFLHELQNQAAKQAKLHQHPLLPKQLDALTSIIGRYPWQVMLVLSGLGAVVIEVSKNLN